MKSTKEKKGTIISFYVTGLVYLLFNLRIGSDLLSSTVATLKQITMTAPYVVAITLVIVAAVQYLSGGEKVPWMQRLRVFFTIGIFAGLVYGIYDYTGGGTVQ